MKASEDFQAAMDAAMAMLDRDELPRSAECFKALLDRAPDSIQANFGLGRALGRQRLAAAEPYLRRVIELDSNHVEALVELGQLLRRLRRRDEAIQTYQAALELDPHHLTAIRSLAHLWRAGGRVSEAENVLRRAIATAPESADIRWRLAEILLLKGGAEEAETLARTAVALDPQSPRAAFALGNVLTARCKYADAANYYERAAELNPSLLRWRAKHASKRYVERDFPAIEAFPPASSANQAARGRAKPPLVLVLGLPRTGTKSALHYFAPLVSLESSKPMHAHGVSNRWLDNIIHPDRIERATRTAQLLRSGRPATVIVPVRESVSRIYSFFLYGNRVQLRLFFDEEKQEFRDRDSIQQDFSAFSVAQAKWEAVWYKEELLQPFGFDFLSVPRDMGGSYTTSVRGRTFIVLRCETMTETLSAAARRISAAVPAGARNSASDLGIATIASAFRKQFMFPQAAKGLLRSNPYSQHLYREVP